RRREVHRPARASGRGRRLRRGPGWPRAVARRRGRGPVRRGGDRMKAVNLLPREARRGSGSLSDLGIGTTAVFAALGLALALVVAYVVLANGVTNRTHTLSDLQAQSAAAEQQVAKLKPYADLEQLRESLLDRV